MNTVEERSPAKLNLSLDVLSRRDDGYHDLRMVMCSVDFGDDVSVALRTDGQISCASNLPWLPRDGRNLAIKAAEVFFDTIGEKNLGADINLVKRIPVGAGMAGGSANAAAVLRALNKLTEAQLDADSLRRIALAIGSDVPYCVAGGNMLAEGRGEILTPLSAIPECSVVICKPAFSVSTAELFHRIEAHSLRVHPDTPGILSAIESGDLGGVARRMYNVFEDTLPRSAYEIRSIRGELLDRGALGAVMTGTGSAVFGLFDDRDKAKEACTRLQTRYRDCCLTKICNEPLFADSTIG